MTAAGAIPGRADIGTVDDLHESASRVIGLTDFGDRSEYGEGLEVLLESYERDEQLTPFGNKMARAALRGALTARAIAEAGFAAHPQHADVPIERPVFVTGLPRTGTTALHRLLCADPGHQGLEMWLTQVPQPRPPRDQWADDPVHAGIQAGFDQHHVENPDFMGVHYMSADTVEECWQLLRQDFVSISYESLAHLPTYSAWLQQQDWTAAYQRHRKNLQLIGLNDRERRWVLKNPSHLFALDAIMAVYPDAVVVQTHRDPRTLIASSCSLSEQATTGQSEIFGGEVIGRSQLDLWSRGAQEFAAARARYPAEQFVDVDFGDLNADPVGVVQQVYAALGLDVSDEVRTAVTATQEESRSGQARPTHRYTLSDYGLTDDEVADAFGDTW